MAISPADILGKILNKEDLRYVKFWEEFIDKKLYDLRLGKSKFNEDGSYSIFLSWKEGVPLPEHIIPALLELYTSVGWQVEHELKTSGNNNSIRRNYFVFRLSIPKQIEKEFYTPTNKARNTTPSHKSGYVYLLEAENGLYKIGRSKHPNFHIAEITKAVAPFSIKAIHSAFYSDCHQAEKDFHKKYKGRRKMGEWFELSVEEIKEIIEHPYEAR